MVQENELQYNTPSKKIKFRNDFSAFHNRVEEVHDEVKTDYSQENADNNESASFWDFFKVEMTRGYMLEHDEERYAARRQKIYSFMRIPRDLERFIVYGIMQCADSFLYIHTFLPVRFVLALWGLITRPIASCLGIRRHSQRLLTPAEICDLLKSSIWIACIFIMLSVDTNRVYHIIKSQSIIKLYIFYNMLEVGDRLLSAFGQDTIDALFWTATEPKNSKRKHIGLLTHVLLALIYVLLHSFLIMFQATSINVAVNSNNKALLTIMMSNNFVELKGAVFKKFDKNNLFQLTCSDVRERFHLSVLLFIVMIQTMKEFDWCFTHFCVLLPDCFAVVVTEVVIDWIKHAFITRFNELPQGIYREYTTSLAYDMTQTRQKHAFSDHSDLVARRMGFIPFPLSVVLIKAVHSAVKFHNLAAFLLFLLCYVFVLGLRICLTICALGKACKLMKEHQDEKQLSSNITTLNSPSNSSLSNNTSRPVNTTSVPSSADKTCVKTANQEATDDYLLTSLIDNRNVSTPKQNAAATHKSLAVSNDNDGLNIKDPLELGATALFSNSDVDLNDFVLSEPLLDLSKTSQNFVEMISSQPDLSTPHDAHNEKNLVNDIINEQDKDNISNNNSDLNDLPKLKFIRTHRRSESEPCIQNMKNKNNTDA